MGKEKEGKEATGPTRPSTLLKRLREKFIDNADWKDRGKVTRDETEEAPASKVIPNRRKAHFQRDIRKKSKKRKKDAGATNHDEELSVRRRKIQGPTHENETSSVRRRRKTARKKKTGRDKDRQASVRERPNKEKRKAPLPAPPAIVAPPNVTAIAPVQPPAGAPPPPPIHEKSPTAQTQMGADPATREKVNWVNTVTEKGIKGLRKEFGDLHTETKAPPADVAAFNEPANLERNRYKNLVCLESTRVKLENAYYHANYVGPNKRFILCQSPSRRTAAAYYSMLIQEQVENVLMLGGHMEVNSRRCSIHFPSHPNPNQWNFCGEFKVATFSRETMPDEPTVNVFDVRIRNGAAGILGHPVKMYQWTQWTDNFPDFSMTLMNLLTLLRNSNKPIVIHCSSGTGKSACVALLDAIVDRLDSGKPADSVELMRELRAQRFLAVQTEMHYLFVHRYLIYVYDEKKIAEMSQTFLQFTDDYDALSKKLAKEEAEKRAKMIADGTKEADLPSCLENEYTVEDKPH